MINNLSEHVEDHEHCGSRDMSRSLGIQQMPPGYALMLNPDSTHFYWLRMDGLESVIDWDRWSVYRGAKANAAKHLPDFRDAGAFIGWFWRHAK